MKSAKRMIVVFLFVLPMIVASAALNAGKGAAIGAVVGTTGAVATKGAKVTFPAKRCLNSARSNLLHCHPAHEQVFVKP